jgi:hypothetical protein
LEVGTLLLQLAQDPVLVDEWKKSQAFYALQPSLHAPIVLVVAGDIVGSEA